MDVSCRCRNCGTLAYVNYGGQAIRCPSCGSVVLNDNDPRVAEDYSSTKNGHLNVIGGDSLDEMISGMDDDEMEMLVGSLLKMWEER